jgi:hypothetical protein
VIVVPQYLLEYWSRALAREGVRFMAVTERLTTADCQHLDGEEYEVVLASSKGYNILTSWARNCFKFARVIFDEPQHITLPCCDLLMARFYWLISCEARELMDTASAFPHTGFIKELLQTLEENRSWWPHVLVGEDAGQGARALALQEERTFFFSMVRNTDMMKMLRDGVLSRSLLRHIGQAF